MKMKELAKKMKERVLNDRSTKILTILLICAYIGSLIYGIYRLNYPTTGIHGPGTGMDEAQAKLVVMQSICACFVAILPYLLLKIFNVKLSFSINLSIQLFTFCGIFLGEACQFYHKITFWDKALHTISGVGVAFVGFAIVSNLIRNTNIRHKVGVSFAVAFLFALSGGLLHELYEFLVDVVAGTNMQKSIPHAWTLGSTRANINGEILSDAELIAFYRTPEGYRYALMDTMLDIVCDFTGALGFCTFGLVFSNSKHLSSYEKLIQFNYLPSEDRNPKDPNQSII